MIATGGDHFELLREYRATSLLTGRAGEDRITTAGDLFEARAVVNGYVAAVVGYETGPLQIGSGFAHALTPGAEHVGKKFLRDPKLGGAHTVMRHEQPSTKPRSDLVVPVAGR